MSLNRLKPALTPSHQTYTRNLMDPSRPIEIEILRAGKEGHFSGLATDHQDHPNLKAARVNFDNFCEATTKWVRANFKRSPYRSTLFLPVIIVAIVVAHNSMKWTKWNLDPQIIENIAESYNNNLCLIKDNRLYFVAQGQVSSIGIGEKNIKTLLYQPEGDILDLALLKHPTTQQDMIGLTVATSGSKHSQMLFYDLEGGKIGPGYEMGMELPGSPQMTWVTAVGTRLIVRQQYKGGETDYRELKLYPVNGNPEDTSIRDPGFIMQLSSDALHSEYGTSSNNFQTCLTGFEESDSLFMVHNNDLKVTLHQRGNLNVFKNEDQLKNGETLTCLDGIFTMNDELLVALRQSSKAQETRLARFDRYGKSLKRDDIPGRIIGVSGQRLVVLKTQINRDILGIGFPPIPEHELILIKP